MRDSSLNNVAIPVDVTVSSGDNAVAIYLSACDNVAIPVGVPVSRGDNVAIPVGV